MEANPTVFQRLIDDATMSAPVLALGDGGSAEAVTAHQRHRDSWYGDLVGPLVVSDQRLAEVGRAGGPGPLDVSVLNSSGAGGLVSLAGRTIAGVQVVSVESALRDLDDLARNAARVVAAAELLSDEVDVFVEIPYAPGWQRAVAVVEESGRHAKLRVGGESGKSSPRRLAEQMSVLVEADLPFKVAGHDGLLDLLAAVEALVDGASAADAADVLSRTDGTDRTALAAQVGSWTETDAGRVRRRLRSVSCPRVLDAVEALVALGLLTPPSR